MNSEHKTKQGRKAEDESVQSGDESENETQRARTVINYYNVNGLFQFNQPIHNPTITVHNKSSAKRVTRSSTKATAKEKSRINTSALLHADQDSDLEGDGNDDQADEPSTRTGPFTRERRENTTKQGQDM
jgi:hypothetical protein